MEHEIEFEQALEQFRKDPFSYVDVVAQHTGRVGFRVKDRDTVEGTRGEWQHVRGTVLFDITREKNTKPIAATTNGEVSFIASELDGEFVQAGEKLVTIRHPLKKKEIIDRILRKVLSVFRAPERAKYFFALDVQSRIEKFGQRAVSVRSGDEIFTMSLMKRDTPVLYSGDPGIIHSIYFQPGVSVDQGDPLIGVCAPEKLPLIQKIIERVKAEWD